MKVGVLKEHKPYESRVALTPEGVRELTAHGHEVLIEHDAGADMGLGDEAFVAAGARILPSSEAVLEQARLCLKVKEPIDHELDQLGPKHILFTFLHLAAHPGIADKLRESGTTAIAYETVQLPDGRLPLLAPMSDIAGRMAAQVGAHFLERVHGGRGVLLSGAPGVPPARATVLGAGRAGSNAALALAALGAQVRILDIDTDKLRDIDRLGTRNIVTVYSNLQSVEDSVGNADLVVGAVLVVGRSAPVLVDEDLVRRMRERSVLVDISIDQGGSFATSRETTHDEPVYVVHDVLHYAVGNIPGAVPHTSTYALTNATMRYVVALADGLEAALKRHPELVLGINIAGGQVTHAAVAETLGVAHVPAEVALGLALGV